MLAEPVGVGGVGGVEGDGALGADLAGGAVVNLGGGVHPMPLCRRSPL